MWSEGKVRIRDIADELGVSTATVSNVLHGKTEKISERTVKAVEKKLEERGYIPNMAAALLARNNSRIIGVVVNDHPKYEGHVFEDPFISAAVNHLSDRIEEAGYYMMLKKARRVSDAVVFASIWNLDGMVLIGFCEDDYQDLRDRIRVPFVIYDGFADAQERFGNVVIDDFDGGRQAGAYLRDIGHERVLFICYLGLCDGLGHKAELMIVPMKASERESCYRERLEALKGYTAVFAASDQYALELIRFLGQNGLSVPGDISVIGFDGSREAKSAAPRLTTVSQDNFLRAEAAVSLLLKMISGTDTEKTVTIPVKLTLGESVRRIG